MRVDKVKPSTVWCYRVHICIQTAPQHVWFRNRCIFPQKYRINSDTNFWIFTICQVHACVFSVYLFWTLREYGKLQVSGDGRSFSARKTAWPAWSLFCTAPGDNESCNFYMVFCFHSAGISKGAPLHSVTCRCTHRRDHVCVHVSDGSTDQSFSRPFYIPFSVLSIWKRDYSLEGFYSS